MQTQSTQIETIENNRKTKTERQNNTFKNKKTNTTPMTNATLRQQQAHNNENDIAQWHWQMACGWAGGLRM